MSVQSAKKWGEVQEAGSRMDPSCHLYEMLIAPVIHRGPYILYTITQDTSLLWIFLIALWKVPTGEAFKVVVVTAGGSKVTLTKRVCLNKWGTSWLLFAQCPLLVFKKGWEPWRKNFETYQEEGSGVEFFMRHFDNIRDLPWLASVTIAYLFLSHSVPGFDAELWRSSMLTHQGGFYAAVMFKIFFCIVFYIIMALFITGILMYLYVWDKNINRLLSLP